MAILVGVVVAYGAAEVPDERLALMIAIVGSVAFLGIGLRFPVAPVYAIILYESLLSWRSAGQVQILGFNRLLFYSVMAGAFVVALFRKSILQGRRLRIHWIDCTIALLIAANILVAISSVDWRTSRSGLTYLLATMSTYYTVRLAVNKEKHLRQILLFLLALMVFEAVVGLMQAVSGEGVIYVRSEPGGNLFPRATGTLGNGLGWYLSVGFIIALNLWLHSKRTARSALSVAALAIISSGLIVANTRGAWVDCAIATGVSLVPVLSSKRLRRKALLACSVALALVGVILIGEDSRERLSSVWEQVLNPAQSTVGFRFYVWESAVEMFKSRPAVGVGQDNFKPLLPDYVSPLANRYLRVSADRSYTVHHAGLQILAESGLAGAATFALFVFAYIRQAFAVHRLLRVTDEGVAKALLVFALMSTLSILYGGYSFGGYTQVGRLYFIMVGLTVAQADVIRRLRKHQ